METKVSALGIEFLVVEGWIIVSTHRGEVICRVAAAAGDSEVRVGTASARLAGRTFYVSGRRIYVDGTLEDRDADVETVICHTQDACRFGVTPGIARTGRASTIAIVAERERERRRSRIPVRVAPAGGPPSLALSIRRQALALEAGE